MLEDQSIRVKCMLAEGSGRLDLSDCELVGVPPAAFDIPGGCHSFSYSHSIDRKESL